MGRTFVYLLTVQDPNQFYDPQTDELNSSFDLDLSSGLIFNFSFATAMATGITFHSIIAGIVLKWLSRNSASKVIGNR
ncbi:MAG: hypothetical protein QNJ49_06460 [Mastigocoleus sp. MO_167.B18]|nr:hypothetical protein [Mastigocoleus sp. MO_167.B18]